MNHDQRQAFIDRQTFLNWKPARGGQMAIAMVDAFCASKSKEITAVEQRIAQNVRTMR